jgi:CubicO group peptidase (beta-lactamase class C family)
LHAWEQGAFILSEPVWWYLPEFKDTQVKVYNPDCSYYLVPQKREMVIQDLFTMSAGLNYDTSNAEIRKIVEETNGYAPTREVMKGIAKIPLEFQPRERWNYSLCHDVLGAVVEIASEMKLSEYLQKNVFDPLGMKDIGFRPSEEQKKRFSAQYNYHNGSNYSTPVPTGNPYAFTPDYDSGGAGLFSTVDEYMKMITVLANGGTTKDGYVLLRPESIEMMGKNLLNEAGRSSFVGGRRYGYGWGLCGRAHVDPTVSFMRTSVGEFGWDGAAGAFCMVDPKKNIALYFGTHLFGFGYGYDRLHWKLLNLAIEAIEE